MTSRTPMGAQPRPTPQRTVSSSGLTGQSQRPTHQRTLSGQYLSQSPVRREGQSDPTIDLNDAAIAQNRYGSVPRRGGSRLKLELSNESMIFQPVVGDSPQTLTPSRVMPKNDYSSSLADTGSPASNKAQPSDSDNPPMPMPKRRPRFGLPTTPKEPSAPSIATKKDGRPKPYTAEVPAAAPHYAPLHKKADASKAGLGGAGAAKEPQETGHADFFPWNGHHAEDRLSDSVIKQGFFDKAPVAQTETTSAKTALFPALKHKTGLNLLSSIFVGVLNQRKHNGQVTAPSAFKPPPRVTLTDTKKEVWMRDLANPAISLRRLSRTIPHGIRGKGLLDHCLNKGVPTERAVWLVRCVGANDLRTVKRKGVGGAVVMGGEMKWLKDWTGFVEQFVESVASAVGVPDWKARFQYAIRLATHIYAEHLVDRDHYMDWLVGGLSNSTQAKLPMWLLITQIYWKDLLRLRKYGRRLASALLMQLDSIHNDPDRDLLAPLSVKLTALLLPLISSHPESFLSPTSWLQCRDALLASIPIEGDAAHNAFRSINSRNEKLVPSSSASPPASRLTLIRHLDATFQSMQTTDLTSTCWHQFNDKAMVLRTVLDWATSVYRPGHAKIYVAASLLRSWFNMGVDVTTSVLEFLDASPPREPTSKRALYQLMSELVRSGHFNLQGYLLWLIARGGLRDPSDINPDGPCATRLLAELPLHHLSPSFREARANLLRRAAFDVHDEERDIDTALKHVRYAFGLSLNPQDPIAQRKPMSRGKLCRAVGSSGRALQTDVGLCILGLFGDDDFNITLRAFHLGRSILEATQDYSILAEVIRSTMRHPDPDLLASCADAVNLHLPEFAGLGVARALCDGMLERLKTISDEQGATRPALSSLANLASRLPGLSNTAAHLRKELQRSDRNTAIDACSPVSDNMATRLQDSEGELNEEIEKLLASGNSVDRPTMDRLFHCVVSRLEGCWTQDVEKQLAYSSLLARLRVFDTQHFDVRMTDWVHHLSIQKSRPALTEIYPYLISLGCLQFSTILSTVAMDAGKPQGAPAQAGSASTYMQQVLQLVVMPLTSKAPMTSDEVCRFHIQQRVAHHQDQKDLTVLIRNALIEFVKLEGHGKSELLPLADQGLQEQLLDLLRLFVLQDSAGTARVLGAKPGEAAIERLLSSITTKLLAPSKDPDLPMSFEAVLEMANDLALPFCQLKLSIGLSAEKATCSEDAEQPPPPVDMLSKVLEQAANSKNMMWTSILSCLSEEVTEQLRRQAQLRFLGLFPSQKSPSTSGPVSEGSTRLSKSLLSIVESIVHGRSSLETSQLTAGMVEKMAELWDILTTRGDEQKGIRMAVIRHWLPALLRFVMLHVTEQEPAASPAATPSATNATAKLPGNAAANETRARMLVILSGLILELDNLDPGEAQALGDLQCNVFDLAMLLVDNLPEDARLQCVRAVLTGGNAQSPASSDARLRYLFSYTPPWMEQFMLAHRQTPATPTTPSAGVTSRPRIPISVQGSEKLTPYVFRKWEMLCEPSPVVGENDTALSLTLFEAIKMQS